MSRAEISEIEKARVSKLQSEFNADLLKEDELGVVIRAHIRIESHLIDIIDVVFGNPEIQKIIDPDYDKRVRLCIALGLDPTLKPCLSFVGNLRNRFAHGTIKEMSTEDANNFEKTLTHERKESVRLAYRSAMHESGRTPVPIKNLSPKDRIILCLVNVWSAVAAGAAQARADHVQTFDSN